MFQTEVVEKIKIHVLCSVSFFSLENRAVWEGMWKIMVEPHRSHMTTWRKRVTCWLPKVINTHSEYIIISAFPVEHLLHESAPLYVIRTLRVLFYWRWRVSTVWYELRV